MSEQFRFFATQEDLVQGLGRVAESVNLKFVDAWIHRDLDEIPVFEDLTRWSGLGKNSSGRAAGAGFFIVVEASQTLVPKTIHLSEGGTNFKYEPLANPSSIVFQPSGIYTGEEESVIVCGMCGTALGNAESINLYGLFRKAFLKDFSKLSNGAYLGPDAAAKVEKGQFSLK